ncbi:MAG: hypothetical protein ACJAT7_000071 [Psychromonas sp.]|jgi:hypothetical protein|uniref:hypothetical protein n=1 Tax=Psychromonas sp. TaxID=1884585 RepID=UPI0039E5BFD4
MFLGDDDFADKYHPLQNERFGNLQKTAPKLLINQTKAATEVSVRFYCGEQPL